MKYMKMSMFYLHKKQGGNRMNNYYYQQPQQIKTAETILAEIDQAIKDTIQYTSVSKITTTLDRLRQSGDIIDVF